MNALLAGVLSTLRRERGAAGLELCAVCRRRVAPHEAHTTLRAGAPVHRHCAVYRAGRQARRRA